MFSQTNYMKQDPTKIICFVSKYKLSVQKLCYINISHRKLQHALSNGIISYLFQVF